MQRVCLDQADARDVLALIMSPTLTLSANNAARIAQLQAILSNAVTEPQDVVSATEFRVVHDTLEKKVKEIDGLHAQLEACARALSAKDSLLQGLEGKSVRTLESDSALDVARVPRAVAEGDGDVTLHATNVNRAVLHCDGCGVSQGERHLIACRRALD